MPSAKRTPFVAWLIMGVVIHLSVRAIIYFSTFQDPKAGIARFILEFYYLCFITLLTIAVLVSRLSPKTLAYSFALCGTTLFLEWSFESIGFLANNPTRLNVFHFIALCGSSLFFLLLYRLLRSLWPSL